MNGPDFIPVSEAVVSLGHAGSRSATSRAYYAAFHITLKLLDDFQCVLPHRSKHDDPITCLSYATHQTGKSAGVVLGNLQGCRVKADYHFEELAADDQDYGQYSIKQAKKVDSLIKEFRATCASSPELKAKFCGDVQAYIKRKYPHAAKIK